MSNLASAYAGLGRNEDALALDERVLEFMRRALPENHPNLGRGVLGVMFGTRSPVFNRNSKFSDTFHMMYRRGHDQSCLFVRCSRAVR